MKYFSSIILVVLLTVACAASNVHYLKHGFSRYEVIDVEGDYITIYKLIEQKIQQCFGDSKTLTIEKNAYHAIKMGEFGLRDSNNYVLLIELIASKDDNTKIGVYTTRSAWFKYRHRIEGWRNGTDKACQVNNLSLLIKK